MPKVTNDGSLRKKPPPSQSPRYPGQSPYVLPTTAQKRGRPKKPPLPYPPPPPPPPPPENNPYYCKFFEEYWRNYAQGYQAPPGVLPPPPGASFSNAPPAANPHGPPPPTPMAVAKMPDVLNEYPVKTDRKTYCLATPDDPNHLSEKHCYVRTRLAELFVSEQGDVDNHIRGRRAGFVGQIGLRCVFCVPALESRDRVERARCYPTTTAKLYQTVQDMQHFHFNTCPAIPSWIREKYQSLSANMNKRRNGAKMSPKDYWTKCCADWGLVDHIGDDGSNAGVKLKDGHSLVERSRLPDYAKELFMPPVEKEGDGMVADNQEENEDDGEMKQFLAKEVKVPDEKDKGGFDDLVADLDDSSKGGDDTEAEDGDNKEAEDGDDKKAEDGDDEKAEDGDDKKAEDGDDKKAEDGDVEEEDGDYKEDEGGDEGESGDDQDGESC